MATIFVSEAASGTGAYLANCLAHHGHQVVAASESGDFPDGTLAGLGIVPVQMDITDAASIRSAVAEAIELFPELDTVIANGTFGTAGPLEYRSEDEVARLININLTGQLLLLRAMVPHLRTADRARIIGMSSPLGLIGTPGGVIPCAARAGFEVGLDALRHELLPVGITVSVVQACPPNISDYGLPLTVAEDRDGAYDRLVLGVNHFGCQTSAPQEVADLVRHVLEQDTPPFRSTVSAHDDILAELRSGDEWRTTPLIRELFDLA